MQDIHQINAVEDYLRDAIHTLLDDIDRLDPIDTGCNLDVDTLRGSLEPLITSPEITWVDLEDVRTKLDNMRQRIEDWQEYRDDIDSEIADIIRAATPAPEPEETALLQGAAEGAMEAPLQ